MWLEGSRREETRQITYEREREGTAGGPYSGVLATFLKEAAGLQVLPLSREVKRDALVVLLRGLGTWTTFVIIGMQRSAPA